MTLVNQLTSSPLNLRRFETVWDEKISIVENQTHNYLKDKKIISKNYLVERSQYVAQKTLDDLFN